MKPRIEKCKACGGEFDVYFGAPKRKIPTAPIQEGNHLWETWAIDCPHCGAETDMTMRVSQPIDVNTVN